MANAVSNIEAAIPLLMESTRKLERNPNDKKAQQDLQDLLAQLEEPVSMMGMRAYFSLHTVVADVIFIPFPSKDG